MFFNFSNEFVLKTVESEEERIRAAVVKSFKKKFIPKDLGIKLSSWLYVDGTSMYNPNNKNNIFFMSMCLNVTLQK